MKTNTPLKIAWVERDPVRIEANRIFSSVMDIHAFEKETGYLDASLARNALTSKHDYDGIILDNDFFKGELWPLDNNDSGEHLLQDIRSFRFNKSIPIIIYGLNQDPPIESYKRLGANFYVPKSAYACLPVDMGKGVISLNKTRRSSRFERNLVEAFNGEENLMRDFKEAFRKSRRNSCEKSGMGYLADYFEDGEDTLEEIAEEFRDDFKKFFRSLKV